MAVQPAGGGKRPAKGPYRATSAGGTLKRAKPASKREAAAWQRKAFAYGGKAYVQKPPTPKKKRVVKKSTASKATKPSNPQITNHRQVETASYANYKTLTRRGRGKKK